MRPALATLALLTLAALPAFSAPTPPELGAGGQSADLPIHRVTLYTSGVGYFERSGPVDGDAVQTLLFPIGQVNDVLKSLVLLDTGGGSIRPVTYAAQDPLDRQLQSFSVDLSDNPDRATLLNRLRGTSVTVTAGAETVTGTIIGVETQTVTLPNGGGATPQSTLNLSSDDGLHSIPLATVSALKINDPKGRVGTQSGAGRGGAGAGRGQAGGAPGLRGARAAGGDGGLPDGSASVADDVPAGAGQVAGAARLGAGSEHQPG